MAHEPGAIWKLPKRWPRHSLEICASARTEGH
jgi:hypothetical protein